MRMITVSFCLSAMMVSMAVAEEKAPNAKEEKITYEQHILPIFREKCGSCHNANDKKGDLVLDNYGLTMQGGASGAVVAEGDASSSQLYLVIAHLSEPKMPPQQPKMPDEQIALVRKWIEGGALQNAGSKAKAKKTLTVGNVVVSNTRPAGPPPMPEGLPLDPLVVASRGNGVTAIASNPWSSLIAVAGHKQVALYDARTSEMMGILPFPEGVAHVLKFSRNGQWLLAGGGRGGQSGTAVLFDVKTGKRMAEIGSEYDVVLAADISPDHTQVALGGPKKIVRVYDTSTGDLLYEKNKHTDWITAIEFSPDGVLLATGDRSNGLLVWEAFTGREFYVLQGHTAAVTDVSWSADSNLLASTSEDTTIRVWEMQNGGQVKNWGAHGGGSLSVEFIRDNRLASIGRDQVAKLWDLNGANLRAFPAMADVGMEVAFDADDDYMIGGDLSGAVSIWNAKDGAVISQLNTNPPTLAKQIEVAAQASAAADAAAQQSSAALAALTKTLADKKAAADSMSKIANESAVELDLASKLKTLADTDVAVKNQALQVAEATLASTQAAFGKAQQDREAVSKTLTELRTKVKAGFDAVAQAEAELVQANAAFDAKPDDGNAKAASAAAAKKLADALNGVSDLAKQSATVALDQIGKTEAIAAVTASTNAARAARDAAANAKAASDDTAAKIGAKFNVVAATAQAAKANSDKAAADATITPEIQAQLTAAEAAANANAANANNWKARLERTNAAKGRTMQTLEASLK